MSSAGSAPVRTLASALGALGVELWERVGWPLRWLRRHLGRAFRVVLPPARVHRLLEAADRHGWALLGGVTVLAAALPFVGLGEGYYMTIASELFLFGVLALSWDLVGGQTGYPSFGNMAFFGIGAYATAILTKDFAVGFPTALVVAGVLSLAFAGAIGIVVLRLRGGYFAIATLGVLLTAQQVSRNLEITGGASGKILLDIPSQRTFYYLFLAILVVEIAVVYYLSKTRFGYVLNAVRDDEAKATAMGFDTTYYKTAAWMLAGLFTGVVGGTWSLFNTFIDPQTAYNAAWNVELIAMALLGGTGTVVGPVLGAAGLHAVVVVVETAATGWQLIVVGTVVIATVVAFPRGAVGSLAEYASELEYYKFGGGAQVEGEGADGTGSERGAEAERESAVAENEAAGGTGRSTVPAVDDETDMEER